MNYTKPQVVMFGLALAAVQGIGVKNGIYLDAIYQMYISSASAYQADE